MMNKDELNIGKLDKRISICEMETVEGRLGNDKTVLKEKYVRWAEITPLKSKEQIVNYHDQADIVYKIIIRYIAGLKQNKHYIYYQGKVLNITSIIDINMQHKYYEILAQEEVEKEYEFSSQN